MISITEKKDCCGCDACVQCCPKNCISMSIDEEGFKYPIVNLSQCIDCSLCEKVCPMLAETTKKQPLNCYASYCRDEEIRRDSSSGGIFTVLATKVISEGGVVFGARFDKDWSVCHDYTDTLDGLVAFRGSKYLQSNIDDSFRKVREFLMQGRKVLFSGTPCQIAGLHGYLRRHYDNLLTVDFVCHGVPSPKVWQDYLMTLRCTSCAEAGKNSESLSLKRMPPTGISFRDKQLGWKKYGIHFKMSPGKGDKNTESALCANHDFFQPFTENPYMEVFLSNLSLRPACYNCPSKGFTSGSDITLGDFWGIEHIDHAIDDDKGVSLLFIHNNTVKKMLDEAGVFLKEEPFDEAVHYNPSVLESVAEPAYRAYFFKKLNSTHDFSKAYDAVFSRTLVKRITRRLWLQLSKK